MQAIGGERRHVLVAMVVAFAAVGGAAQATAPTARAECEGGIAFDSVVGRAHGAVVGRVAASSADQLGFITVSAVRVERAFGVSLGRTYRGTIPAANPCTDDGGRVGDRVVVLVGVPDAVAPHRPVDLFFTIGRSVTPSQADSIGSALPDTATASGPARLPIGQPTPVVLPVLAGFVALVLTLLRGSGPRGCATFKRRGRTRRGR